MSDSNPPSPSALSTAANPSELTELREICADLRWQTHTLRIAVLIVASALAAFFWLEVRRSSHALTMLRPQAVQILEASKVQDRFVGQLVEFGKAHPDFAAILKKYQIQSSAGPTNVPAAAPPVK
jgi:hypothetical protein